MGTGTGTSQGQAMSTHSLKVQVLESIGMTVNDEEVDFREFDEDLLDAEVATFTGFKPLSVPTGWDEGESDLTLIQNQGLPWTVLALIRGITVNAG